MLEERYLKQIKEIVDGVVEDETTEVFLFGSSLKEGRFGDLDLGLMGKEVDQNLINTLKDSFEDSDSPFLVDVVNFNKVSEDFKNNIFNKEILWIKKL